ncbi:ddb1 and cul4 associated factor 7 [Phytophthora pseudosyringae]|uniref:Ddb1 and cul4 associated factor 7 n=1 Tax=Phytophthora pseudosyringae TaxID=221518 RepID=A0A8T1WFF8_9STRA|nr:ddb1 and cul4 associated factor 7 [Phytophthora pseudosyringae]
MTTPQRSVLCDRPFITYPTRDRLYGLCWRPDVSSLRIAASTFIPGEYANKIEIFHPTANQKEVVSALEIDHPYPPTKIMWSPASLGSHVELLATTADFLRLWTISDSSIELHSRFTEKKNNNDACAPLTSFDWNEVEPNIIGTSSTGNTCTIWDINQPTSPKQQIVAHDTEVYDIAFSSSDPKKFASVGGDGSLRLFDLRSLASSTIVYEAPNKEPLLRLAWNKRDDRFIATFADDSSKISVIDLRRPIYPMAELNQHKAGVNSMSWSPHSRYDLCSAGEDNTAIVYDICAQMTRSGENVEGPCYTLLKSDEPINQIRWSPTEPNCIALCDEKALHVVQM